ncbi:MAG: hypothetical protein AAFU78_05720, partial [Cyanobacteria bacterium J06633_2]
KPRSAGLSSTILVWIKRVALYQIIAAYSFAQIMHRLMDVSVFHTVGFMLWHRVRYSRLKCRDRPI